MSSPPRQTYREEMDAVTKIRTMRRQLASGAGATIVRQKGGSDEEQLLGLLASPHDGDDGGDGGGGTSVSGGATFTPQVRKGAYGSSAVGLSVQSNYGAMLALFSENGGAPPVATTEHISIPFELFEAVQTRSVKLKDMLEKANADAVAKTDELTRSRTSLKLAHDENKNLQGKVESKNTEINNLHTSLQKLSEQLAASERKAVVATDQRHDAVRALKTKVAELDEARYKASDLLVSVTQRESIIVALKREKADLNKKLQTYLEEADGSDEEGEDDVYGPLDDDEDTTVDLSASKLLSLHRSQKKKKATTSNRSSSPKANRLRAMLKGLVENNRQGPTRARVQELEAERVELESDIAELYAVHDEMRTRMQTMSRAYECHCLFLEDRLSSGTFVDNLPKLQKQQQGGMVGGVGGVGGVFPTTTSPMAAPTSGVVATTATTVTTTTAADGSNVAITTSAGGSSSPLTDSHLPNSSATLQLPLSPAAFEGSTRRAKELFLQDSALTDTSSAYFEPLSQVQNGASQLLQAVHELSTMVLDRQKSISIGSGSIGGGGAPRGQDPDKEIILPNMNVAADDAAAAAEIRTFKIVLSLLDSGLSNIKSSITTIVSSSSAASQQQTGFIPSPTTAPKAPVFLDDDLLDGTTGSIQQHGAWTRKVTDGSLFGSSGKIASVFIMDPTKLGGDSSLLSTSFGIKRTTLKTSSSRSGVVRSPNTWSSAAAASRISPGASGGGSGRRNNTDSPSSYGSTPARGAGSSVGGDDGGDVTLSVPSDCAVSRHLEGAADAVDNANTSKTGVDGSIKYAAGHSASSSSVSPVDNLMSALHVYRTIITKLLGYGANLSTALEESIKSNLRNTTTTSLPRVSSDTMHGVVPVVSPALSPDSGAAARHGSGGGGFPPLTDDTTPMGITLANSADNSAADVDKSPFGTSFCSAEGAGVAGMSMSGSQRGDLAMLSMWRRSVPRDQIHSLLRDALNLSGPKDAGRVAPLLQTYFESVMLLKFGIGGASNSRNPSTGSRNRANSIGASDSVVATPPLTSSSPSKNTTKRQPKDRSGGGGNASSTTATQHSEEFEIEIAQYLGATEGMAAVAATSDKLLMGVGGGSTTPGRNNSTPQSGAGSQAASYVSPRRFPSNATGGKKMGQSFRAETSPSFTVGAGGGGSGRGGGVLHKRTLSMHQLPKRDSVGWGDIDGGEEPQSKEFNKIESFSYQSIRQNATSSDNLGTSVRPSQRAALSQQAAAASKGTRGKVPLNGAATQDLAQGLVGNSLAGLGGRVHRNAQLMSEKLLEDQKRGDHAGNRKQSVTSSHNTREGVSGTGRVHSSSSIRSDSPDTTSAGTRGVSAGDGPLSTNTNNRHHRSPTTDRHTDTEEENNPLFYQRKTITDSHITHDAPSERASKKSSDMVPSYRKTVFPSGLMISSFGSPVGSDLPASVRRHPASSPKRFAQKTYPHTASSSAGSPRAQQQSRNSDTNRPWRRQVTTKSPITISIRSSPAMTPPSKTSPSGTSSIRVARKMYIKPINTANNNTTTPTSTTTSPVKGSSPTSVEQPRVSSAQSSGLGNSRHFGESVNGTTAPPSERASKPPSREHRGDVIKSATNCGILSPSGSSGSIRSKGSSSPRSRRSPQQPSLPSPSKTLCVTDIDFQFQGSSGPSTPPSAATISLTLPEKNSLPSFETTNGPEADDHTTPTSTTENPRQSSSDNNADDLNGDTSMEHHPAADASVSSSGTLTHTTVTALPDIGSTSVREGNPLSVGGKASSSLSSSRHQHQRHNHHASSSAAGTPSISNMNMSGSQQQYPPHHQHQSISPPSTSRPSSPLVPHQEDPITLEGSVLPLHRSGMGVDLNGMGDARRRSPGTTATGTTTASTSDTTSITTPTPAQQQQKPSDSTTTQQSTTTTTNEPSSLSSAAATKRRSIGDMSRHVLESVSSMQMEMLSRHEMAFSEAAATAMLPKLPGPGTPTQSAAFMMTSNRPGDEIPLPLLYTPAARSAQDESIPAFEIEEPARSATDEASSTPQHIGTNISTPLNSPQDPSTTGSPPLRSQSSPSLKSSADTNRELTLPKIGKSGGGGVAPFSLEASLSSGQHREKTNGGGLDGVLPSIDGHQRRPTGGSNPASPQGRNNSRGGNLSSMSRRRATGSHSSLGGDFGFGSSGGSEHHPTPGSPFFMGGMLTLEGSSIQVSRNPSRRQSFVVTGGTVNVPAATSDGAGGASSSSGHGSGTHWRRRASTKLDHSSSGQASPESTTINPFIGDGPTITLDSTETVGGGGGGQPPHSPTSSALGPKRLSVVTLNMLPSVTNAASSGTSGTSPNPSKQTASSNNNGTTSSLATAPGGKRSSKLAGVSVTSKTVVGPSVAVKQPAPSKGVKEPTSKTSSPNNTPTTASKQPPPKKSPSTTTAPTPTASATTSTTATKNSGGDEVVVPNVMGSGSTQPTQPPSTKRPKKPPTPNAKKSRPTGITINTGSYPAVKSILAGSSQKRVSRVKSTDDTSNNNNIGTTKNDLNTKGVKFAEHDEVVWIPRREPKVAPSNGGSLGGSASDDESPPDSNASSTTSQNEWQASAPHSPSTVAIQNFDTTGASASDGARNHHHVQIDIKKALAMVLPFDDEDELEGMTIPTVSAEDTSPTLPPPCLGVTSEGGDTGGVDGQHQQPGVGISEATVDPSSSTQPQQQLSSITNKPLPPHIQRILDKQQEKARQRSSHDRVPHRYTTMGALVTGSTDGNGGGAPSSSSTPLPSSAGGVGGGSTGGGVTGYITPRQAGSLTAPPHMGPSTPSGGGSNTPNTGGGGGGTPASSQITRGISSSVVSPPHLAPPSSGYLSHHRRSK